MQVLYIVYMYLYFYISYQTTITIVCVFTQNLINHKDVVYLIEQQDIGDKNFLV